MERKLLMKGKVKEAYDLGDRLEFRFTDNISVFDKVIPSLIPFKGETLSREGVYWFDARQQDGHQDPLPGVHPAERHALQKGGHPSAASDHQTIKNYLIPLEFICRWYVAGSLYDRVLEGKIPAGCLGLLFRA